jgi:hypothetical protein
MFHGSWQEISLTPWLQPGVEPELKAEPFKRRADSSGFGEGVA